MLDARVLGPLAVSADGRALKLGGAKQRILLATLVLAEGQPVSTARLQEAMWGDAEPDRDHAHALQAHVSRLRALLPVPVTLGSAGYRIDPHDVRMDATEFGELLAEGREHLRRARFEDAMACLDQALAMWRGPVLADLVHVAALQPAVVHLEELRQRAETDRVDAVLALGRPEEVLPGLQARVEAAPLEEHTWHQLITALQMAGRLSEALACFQRARETFVDELGAEPGPGLMALHQQLLQASAPGAPGAEARSATPEIARRLSRPLAGREREMALMRRTAASAGDGLHLVTVTGEPGIGKTRLVAEFAAERELTGSNVLVGRCDEFMAVPYQPIVEMIRASVQDLAGTALARHLGPYPADLARIMPDLAERLPPDLAEPLRSDPQTELYRTFDAVAGWLANTSRSGPMTLVLDDLQWADRPTLLLVHHLTRSPRRMQTLLLATLRDREQRQDQQAAELLAGLVRQSELVTPVPLAGLDEEEVATLIAQETSSTTTPRVDQDRAARVRAASGGNPLFVVELVRSLSESTEDPTDPGTGALPAGLRELIDQRLQRLSEDVQELLSVASAMGPVFDVATLARAVDMDPAKVDHALVDAEFARLIRPADTAVPRWSFSHDVVRSALYDAIAPMQRSRTHLRIAEALEADETTPGTRPGERATQLAHHLTRALATEPDVAPRAVAHLRVAGDHAMEQRAPAVAVGHYRQAADLLPEDGPVEERCDLLTALGTALFRSGEASYRKVLLEVGTLAMAAADQERLVAAALANNRGWWSSTAEIDHERIAIIEAALRGCDPDDRAVRSQLLAFWALENVRDPAQRERAIETSATALELAEGLDDEQLLATALSHRFAVVHATFSDPHGCVELNERVFRLARRRADPGLRLAATIGLAQSTAMLGEFTVADQALDQALELSETLHQPARLWMTRTWDAMRLATRGRLEDAEAAATAAYELGESSGQPDALTWFAGQLFTFRMLAGRLHEIFPEIEEQAHSQAGGIPSWRAAYALSLTTVDRMDDAAALLAEFVERDFEQLPRDMLWLHGLTYLSLTCHALSDAATAAKLYDALLPHRHLLAHNGTIDAGPVALHLGLLAQVMGDDELAAEHLALAEQTCLRIDAPLWLARVRRAAA